VVSVSEYRRDPVTGRWVLVSSESPRPTDFEHESVTVTPDPQCPLCEGHEAMTPSELWVDRPMGKRPGGRCRYMTVP